MAIGNVDQGAYQLAEWQSRGLPVGAGLGLPEIGKSMALGGTGSAN